MASSQLPYYFAVHGVHQFSSGARGSQEPSLYGRSFPVDLCLDLERGLRAVTRHFRIITWAIQLLEKPQKLVQLKAREFLFPQCTGGHGCIYIYVQTERERERERKRERGRKKDTYIIAHTHI